MEDRLFQAALQHHRQGRLSQAKEIYQQILGVNPDHPPALHLLGQLEHRIGRSEAAVRLIYKAISLKPNSAMFCDLGAVLKAQGKLDAAVESYYQALALKPDDTNVHNSLGAIFYTQNRLDEAIHHYRTATLLDPGYFEALINMGLALKMQGRLDEAAESFRRAISIKPDYPEAHFNLGSTLNDLGLPDEAILSYQRALSINPNFVEAHCELGELLQMQGRLDEAEARYRHALKIKSDYAPGVTAPPPLTALLSFGRSGTMFFHSLFDGHPELATLPGIYFHRWFKMDNWQRFAPDCTQSGWHERLVAMICEEYQPIFDARSKKNLFGRPFSNSNWQAKDHGFMEMGADRSQPFVVDQSAFAATLLALLKPLHFVSAKDCFELIHRAFEIAVRCNNASAAQSNGHIFYHIHNPRPYELAHFLQHYPEARLLHLIRNPVQSMESWMLEGLNAVKDSEGYGTRKTENKISNCLSYMASNMLYMFKQLQSPFNRLDGSCGVRLEDVKRDAHKVMPRIAAWMGISDHHALYESRFCGMQYWGPASKAIGKITGFDTKSIDQPTGRLLGERDILIFETLFWPLLHLYGYTEQNATDFRRQLAQIRPWLDEPFEFETRLYGEMRGHTCALNELPPYRRLHGHLRQVWSVLDRAGTYHSMTQPLKLS
jgi:tetratricopeptide (TPR) repeat protein